MISANPLSIELTEKPIRVPGLLYGFRYPSLVFNLRAGLPPRIDWLDQLNVFLQAELKVSFAAENRESTPAKSCIAFIVFWIQHLQRVTGHPIYDRGRLIAQGQDGLLCVAIPSLLRGSEACVAAFEWFIELCNAAAHDSNLPEVLARLPAVKKHFADTAPIGANVPRFIRAAYEASIPFIDVPGQIFLVGQGCRSRWLDSSFTDVTPYLSTRLARSKVDTAAMLSAAGIPVARHAIVPSAEVAVSVAAQLGYPVVVKPADLDGGTAVAAGLENAEEVREAFEVARQHSSRVLVEKHFEGRDYRLTVLHGELLWAIERVPGGVNGDGASSVRALLERINADPNRGTDPLSPLSPLTLDREAQALLSRVGLDEDGVPAAGQFVRLRRAANVGMGGTPVAVFDQVHPDNRLLAIRAAAALRLDLAGIDLLIPDISRSWKESGAIICEVNAQPQLGGVTSAHVYGQILRALVVGDGRIPIALVLGSSASDQLGCEVKLQLEKAGLVLGVVDASGVMINGERVVQQRVDIYSAARILMLDQSVDAALIFINDPAVLGRGLPFDSFDLLILAGLEFPGLDTNKQTAVLRNIVDALAPSCKGVGMVEAGAGYSVTPPKNGAGTIAWMDAPVESVRLAEVTTKILLDAQPRHTGKS